MLTGDVRPSYMAVLRQALRITTQNTWQRRAAIYMTAHVHETRRLAMQGRAQHTRFKSFNTPSHASNSSESTENKLYIRGDFVTDGDTRL